MPTIPRQRTYIGEGANTSPSEVDALIRGFEGNTGANFDLAPVLVNIAQQDKNKQRYYHGKTDRQESGALESDGSTILGPRRSRRMWNNLTLGIAGLVNGWRGEYDNDPEDNYYSPSLGLVNLRNYSPAITAHELGHYLDFEEEPDNPVRRFSGGPYDIFGGSGRGADLEDHVLQNELAATLYAQEALGKDWGDHRETLEAALGTYLIDRDPYLSMLFRHRDDPSFPSRPVLEPNANWRKDLPKTLADTKMNPVDRHRKLREAMAHVKDEFLDNILQIATLDENGYVTDIPILEELDNGKFRWNPKNKEFHSYDELIPILLDGEAKYRAATMKKSSVNSIQELADIYKQDRFERDGLRERRQSNSELVQSVNRLIERRKRWKEHLESGTSLKNLNPKLDFMLAGKHQINSYEDIQKLINDRFKPREKSSANEYLRSMLVGGLTGGAGGTLLGYLDASKQRAHYAALKNKNNTIRDLQNKLGVPEDVSEPEGDDPMAKSLITSSLLGTALGTGAGALGGLSHQVLSDLLFKGNLGLG